MGGEPYEDPARADRSPTGRAIALAKSAAEAAPMATPEQREAVAGWLNNEAGKEFWRAQAEPHLAAQHLDVANQMRAKAAELVADELAPRREARARRR